jgi:hypothetical protein
MTKGAFVQPKSMTREYLDLFLRSTVLDHAILRDLRRRLNFADKFSAESSTMMLTPSRVRGRYPPPPSPSRSLIGMEKAVPPHDRASSRSPATDRARQRHSQMRSYHRPSFTPFVDTDKPLPLRPRRSSSVYSNKYSHDGPDQGPSVPIGTQSNAYQQRHSALPYRRPERPPSPRSIPSASSFISEMSSQHC